MKILEEVCDELYAVASADHRIMVNDWRAFAVLAAYRELAKYMAPISIPNIDECLSGAATPPEVISSTKWKALSAWHRLHWAQSQGEEGEADYADYLCMDSLHLPHYDLTL